MSMRENIEETGRFWVDQLAYAYHISTPNSRKIQRMDSLFYWIHHLALKQEGAKRFRLARLGLQ